MIILKSNNYILTIFFKYRKAKDDKESRIRKLREKFRCEIAGIIVHYLKPYRKDSCKIGRIQSNEDFNHLARKVRALSIQNVKK